MGIEGFEAEATIHKSTKYMYWFLFSMLGKTTKTKLPRNILPHHITNKENQLV